MSIRTILRSTALLAAVFLSASANAQIFRAYLASDGSDANPCTLALPCRLLPAALTAVASGGEIWMLDSANYNIGTVTIGKSASILAVPGVVGSIVALNGGPAISITAASLKIALRNVVIGPVAGATPGTHGVSMTGASNLSIESSLLANLPNSGVFVSGTGTLKVTDTVLRNTGAESIYIENGARAAIMSTRILDCGHGLYVVGDIAATTTTASMSDSVVSGVLGVGVAAETSAAATVRISLTRSTIERAPTALRSATGGTGTAEVNFGNSMIVDSGSAWFQSGAGSTILSLGNNQMSGNESFTGTKSALAAQ